VFARAFILSFADTGEHDRRYALLTPELGLVSAVVRSVLKPQAKLAGHLDPPHESWVELIWTGGGWQLTQALEFDGFPGLRADSASLKVALRGAGFVEHMARGGCAHEHGTVSDTHETKNLCILWQVFLKGLESPQPNLDRDVWYAQVVLKTLSVLGFVPDFRSCARCQRSAQFGAVLAGGTVWCESCARAAGGGGMPITPETINLITEIVGWPPSRSGDDRGKSVGGLSNSQSTEIAPPYRDGAGGLWFFHAPEAREIRHIAAIFERQARNLML
jgi:recombinational DNA repair protein (RecF pathway)